MPHNALKNALRPSLFSPSLVDVFINLRKLTVVGGAVSATVCSRSNFSQSLGIDFHGHIDILYATRK